MKIRLSVVVIIYKMQNQAMRTLFSLSADYQQKVNHEDYEIIVVENESEEMLDADEISKLTGNFRYYRRSETTQSPVNAINFGAEQARGSHVAIMIDGARMVTPMVIYYTLLANGLHENPIVCVPGYHLGSKIQSIAVNEGYSAAEDTELLRKINWPHHGYALFDISCMAGSTKNGFLVSMNESNFITLQRSFFFELDGYCPKFDKNGGGFANLDFYKRVCESNGTKLFVIFSEGTFHQFHGGETTGKHQREDTVKLITRLSEEYTSIRGVQFEAPTTQANFVGHYHSHLQKFLQHSSLNLAEVNGL